MSLVFGDFTLDQERRQLLRAGEPVPLEPKAFELLCLLLVRRPRVLSKAQIRDVLWPGTSVGETSLPRLVTELRQALGDDAQQPRFIRTAHGFGYAFCGEARDDAETQPKEAPGRAPVEDRPYPGLHAFTEADAEQFFGREAEVAALWEKLGRQKLLAVIGPSGVGKTSFLRAGVIPGAPVNWATAYLTPGASPAAALAGALTPALASEPESLAELVQGARELVQTGASARVVSAVSRWRHRTSEALLVIDQFEELYTLNPEETQQRFAMLLGRLTEEAGVHVLLALRDDFLFRCHDFPSLAPVFRNVTPLEIKQHRTGLFVRLGLFVGAVSLAFAIYHFARHPKPAVVHFQSMKMTRVTTDGSVGSAAISPDGKYLTYSLFEEGKASLWTKHLATGSRVQIVPPVEEGRLDPNTFTHDGGFIYYIRHDQQHPQGTLYEVPVLGGASKRILTNIAWPISLSPDGTQFAFGRSYDDSNEDELLVANVDGTHEHSLLRPTQGGWLSEAAASWSPDGKMLAVGYGKQEGGDHMLVAIVSVADGTMRLMPTPRWYHIGPIVWFGDGNSLALQVEEQESAPPQIWQISYPGGEARTITNDLDSYTADSLTLTADASTLVAVQSETTSNIWIAPEGDASNARAIKSPKYAQDGYDGLTWAPDGRVLYATRFNGKDSIWAMNSDGSNPKPLTDGTADDSLPEVTPDGRYIAFVSLRPGSSQEWRNEQVWRIDIDGSNPKQLSAERNGVGQVSLSPDSHWAAYGTIGEGLRKVSIDGGMPIKLTDKVEHYVEVSPDGRLVAYISVDDETKHLRITIAEFDDGTRVRALEVPGLTMRKFRWSHDGHAIIYVRTRNGVSNLWSQPLAGGAPRQLTDFKADLIYRFSYSRDGKQLALARGNRSRDVVMMSEAK